MSGADDAVDRLSSRLADLSDKAASRGGLVAKLAPPLANDSEFVTKLKPSLIKARAAGETPDGSPPESSREPAVARRSEQNAKRSQAAAGVSPLIVVAAAAAAGILFAKLLDWSGHAYPRT
jgi:hypothetical protein